MHARRADARIGYFTQERFDFSNDTTLTPRINLIQRWRLEKKDPAAEVSEPKEPIVFWIDRNIPVKYRQAIIDGVLEWNKAFEKAGFANAVQAKIQPDDADFETMDRARVDTLDAQRAPDVRRHRPRQSTRAPAILDADIGIDPARLRNRRFMRVEQGPRPRKRVHGIPSACARCRITPRRSSIRVRPARGARRPRSDGPEAEAFVLTDVKDIAMHEVGTPSAAPNFRASTVYTQAQLSDSEFLACTGSRAR